MLRETEWALGSEDGGGALQAWAVRTDGHLADPLPRPLQVIAEDRWEPGMSLLLPAAEFERLCGWGQMLGETDTQVAGEWPSATGP